MLSRIVVKRKASKILTGLAALVLLVSFEILPVSAEECVIEKEPNFNVDLTGDEMMLYADGGVQTMDAGDETGQESGLRCGTVSGYLSESGDYKLYSLNLSVGDYLQARLSVPNNTTLTYALVLYDSELNVIKVCHYIPYLNGAATLEESIGYLPKSNQLIYIGVFSLVGGSETEAFTLDFSVTTNFSSLSDIGEPNENVQEAAALTLGNSGASVSGMLNSALDNDWYSFTVIDSPKYNKIRLTLTSMSSTNGCKIEIYNNLTEDYFTMQYLGGGTGEGETELPAGTYYIRVVSTNTINDFNPGDRPSYNLSVVPVSRVDGIKITKYEGYHVAPDVTYEEGSYYRVDDQPSNWIRITGFAYYTDSMGNKIAAANVKLSGMVVNTEWEINNRPDMSRTYGTAVAGSNGYFSMTVSLNRSLGGRTYAALMSKHYYDFMNVYISLYNEDNAITLSHFYLLDRSVLY